MWASSIIFMFLPKVNHDSLGENSPNLVTLARGHIIETATLEERTLSMGCVVFLPE
jgi:hypothetical protein